MDYDSISILPGTSKKSRNRSGIFSGGLLDLTASRYSGRGRRRLGRRRSRIPPIILSSEGSNAKTAEGKKFTSREREI